VDRSYYIIEMCGPISQFSSEVVSKSTGTHWFIPENLQNPSDVLANVGRPEATEYGEKFNCFSNVAKIVTLLFGEDKRWSQVSKNDKVYNSPEFLHWIVYQR